MDPSKPPSKIDGEIDQMRILFMNVCLGLSNEREMVSKIESISKAKVQDYKYFQHQNQLFVEFANEPDVPNIMKELCTRPLLGHMASFERIPKTNFVQIISQGPVGKEMKKYTLDSETFSVRPYYTDNVLPQEFYWYHQSCHHAKFPSREECRLTNNGDVVGSSGKKKKKPFLHFVPQFYERVCEIAFKE
ncbi:hypothetical protein HELRODRAFT_175657 [Helobdella robusta]|uniref:Uncharacterized protein n=1 Tax=Helobdella robusta TaxID=6412 RepID=T1F9H5_HELRO|nr:hypothetical protein HELRODRAFT_175657 [Helobdella robusta]ESO00674.1 hypothetical protein HELRODRAFT_175657 [Helobdella robusta]